MHHIVENKGRSNINIYHGLLTLIFTMDYKIYIFPTDVELERPSYPDISDNDWDSLIEPYKKKNTHTHTWLW